MRILIAITSCHSRLEHRAAIRETWLADSTQDIEYRFFLGRGTSDLESDEILLDVPMITRI